MRKRNAGISIVETLLAFALVALLVAPAIALIAPREVVTTAARSRATRLVELAVRRLVRRDAQALRELLERVPGGTAEWRTVSWDALGLSDEEDDGGLARGLAAALSVRWMRHVGGRLGLDRIDVRLEYTDARRAQVIARSGLRRDAALEAAVGSLRASDRLEELSDTEFRDALSAALWWESYGRRAGRSGSYAVPSFPDRLARFEKSENIQAPSVPAADPRAASGSAPADDGGQASDEDLLGGAPFARPRFAPAIGTTF